MTWANDLYGYKKKITINDSKVPGNLSNFPVLISVTDANLADTSNGGYVQSSDGYDIVFYNSDEDTVLKHEIERYDNTIGLLCFWVKVPSINSSSPSTYVYIYYGKSDVVVDPSSTDTCVSDEGRHSIPKVILSVIVCGRENCFLIITLSIPADLSCLSKALNIGLLYSMPL